MKEEIVSVVEYRLDDSGGQTRRLLFGGMADVLTLDALCRGLGTHAGTSVVCARRERWSLDEWACLYEDGRAVAEQAGTVDLEGLLDELVRLGGGRKEGMPWTRRR